ncbi:hypothetical protein ACFWFI_09755 [Streptomyces sp. NPDC060209]|uniref:hypothetical protein n=1 Tax=Streptomyces sp. NPDC060209 TaxID=3347073 RepID=UPI00365B68DE
MPIPAGSIVTAGQLTRMQPTPYYRQAQTATAISTLTFVAVGDCTITLTTLAANALFVCQANFSYDTQTPVTSVYTRGGLFVDGVQQSGESRWSEGTTGGDGADYDMAGKAWSGVLATAGAHTLDLRCALNSITSGPVITCTGFTDMLVTIYEVV